MALGEQKGVAVCDVLAVGSVTRASATPELHVTVLRLFGVRASKYRNED